ncbi:MAG: lipopolysaccharide assembly protein LapB [Gammaproteobacteria bacterium]
MAPEILYGFVVFLLPIAAFSGWLIGRKDNAAKQRGSASSTGMSPDYFKGLNYLLNDRPDKAIEVFIKVLEVESETVETHLALGNLFRRRGEVDRAIRIHQNLVARPTLDIEQRSLALLELGLDYMRSGLLDRAESLFKELLETKMFEQQALRNLVDIFQQEQDWEHALEYIKRLENCTGEDQRAVRAHFYCEKAQLALTAGDEELARQHLNTALKQDRKCVRASLMIADIASSHQDYKESNAALKKIENQDIDFLPEAINVLVKNYRALNDLDGLSRYLTKLSELHSGITPILVLAELAADSNEIDKARKYIIEELRMRPTVRGIDRLIEYLLTDASGEAEENLRLLKETTGRLLEEKKAYNCGICGFTGRSLHWQCPGCKSWNTVKPIHGIEGE